MRGSGRDWGQVSSWSRAVFTEDILRGKDSVHDFLKVDQCLVFVNYFYSDLPIAVGTR